MISEKTDEEKLRQELEGGFSENNQAAAGKAKPLKSAHRTNQRRNENISGIIDTFIDDFERRVEQSLNASNIRSTHHESVRPVRKAGKSPADSTPVVPEHDDLLNEEAVIDSPAEKTDGDVFPDDAEELNVTEETDGDVFPDDAEDLNVTEETDSDVFPSDAEELNVTEETDGDVFPDDAEDLNVTEETDSDVFPSDTEELNVTEETDNDVFPSDAEEADDDLPDIPVLESETPSLPDIPVIYPDNEASDDEAFNGDIIYPEDDKEPEESEKKPSALPELQETELIEGPEIEDNEESPLADVVVNVDDVLPQIGRDDEEVYTDPESESVPVTVTMPESTKTAEDKLMADIAEAMTGNPLSLDSKDFQPAYNLPENFFDGGDSQSAEDKLKANIAQALSESPIDAAQSQVNQDIEQDLNPFDEISTPDNFPDEPSETDQEIFDAPEEIEDSQPEDINDDFDVPPENNIAETDDFDIPSESDNVEANEEQEAVKIDDDVVVDENDLPFPVESDENIETSNDEDSILSQDDEEISTDDFAGLPFSLGDDDEEETEPEPEENLIQEQDKEIQETQEEAQPENKMPEESLLDDETAVEETNDDWDISSLGELSQAATIPDDDPEDVHPLPETLTEVITQPEAGITHSPEDYHKEKTMSIREKLASRKNAKSDGTTSGKSSIILPLLLILLLIVGALMLWQIMQLSDNIVSLARSGTGNFESVRISEPNPSYDYAIEFILDPNLHDRMSQRGRDGWQVVGSRRTQDSTSGQYGYEFIFMRRVSER